MKNKILIIIFMLIIVLPNIVFWISDVDENFENRVLAEKPTMNINTIAEYPNKFNLYYEDHLPFKDILIKLNSYVKFYALNKSPQDYVVKGNEGWLFYNSIYKNDGDVIGDYQGTTVFSEEQMEKMREIFLSMQQACDSIGSELIFVFPNNKASIYGEDYLPQTYPKLDQQSRLDKLVDYLQGSTDLNIVYPKEKLLKNKDKYQLYYKLDTHWNDAGAYLLYNEIKQEYSDETIDLLEKSIIKEIPIEGGDLAWMIQVSGLEDMNYEIAYKNDIVLNLVESDEGEIKKYRYLSSNRNGKKLLMYRDSFATSMMPFISKDFEESYYDWTWTFDIETLRREKPDVVIYEVIERGVIAIPFLEHKF